MLHLFKGLDIAESVIAIVTAVYLWSNGRYFRTKVDESSVVRGLLTLVVGGVAAITAGMIAVMTIGGEDRPVARRGLRGRERTPRRHRQRRASPNRMDRFLEPTLLAASVGLAVAAGWLLFRPVLARSLARAGRSDRAGPPARRAVRRRHVVVLRPARRQAVLVLRRHARRLRRPPGRVPRVARPDRPEAEQREAWAAFRAFADDHGWPVAVMGAGEDWLPIYEASGMHDLYVGDEAVVDVRRFNLDGGRNKGLRQAVNRIAQVRLPRRVPRPFALEPALEASSGGS